MIWVLLVITVVNTIWLVFLSRLIVKILQPPFEMDEEQREMMKNQLQNIPALLQQMQEVKMTPDYTSLMQAGNRNFDGVTPQGKPTPDMLRQWIEDNENYR